MPNHWTHGARAALAGKEGLRPEPTQRGKCKECGRFFDPPTSQCPTCAEPLDFPYLRRAALAMNIKHELRTDIGGTSRRTEELMGRAAARIERLEAERDIVLKSFEDACDAIGCPYDNEALLMAIAALAGKSHT